MGIVSRIRNGQTTLWVSNQYFNFIFRVDSEGGATVVAGNERAAPGFLDGNGTESRMNYPTGLALDNNDLLYIADSSNNAVRTLDTNTGLLKTIAGTGAAGFLDGIGSIAMFFWPTGVAVDSAGFVYVADFSNQRVRKIAATPERTVSTLAGGGKGAFAVFLTPASVLVDRNGLVYVVDANTCRIVTINAAGLVNPFVGGGASGSECGFNDGVGTAALFRSMAASYVWITMNFDAEGNMLATDPDNHLVRRILVSTAMVNTIAGNTSFPRNNDTSGSMLDGPASQARFNFPFGVAVGDAGQIYVVDGSNSLLRVLSPAPEYNVSTFSGAAASDAKISVDGAGSVARFNYPGSVFLFNGAVYIAECYGNRIRVMFSNSTTITIAGSLDSTPGLLDGFGTNARFNCPYMISAAPDGVNLLVADYNNNAVRLLTPAGLVSTFAGLGQSGYLDGPASTALFSGVSHAVADPASGLVYVTDTANNCIRLISQSNQVSTVAGTCGIAAGTDDGAGPLARFNSPTAFLVRSNGTLLISDLSNFCIRQLDAATGMVTTVLGKCGEVGFLDGVGTNSRWNSVAGLAMDADKVSACYFMYKFLRIFELIHL